MSKEQNRDLSVRQGSDVKKYDDKPRLPSKAIYRTAAAVLGPYVKLRYRVKIDNGAMKKTRGPVVVLSNHCSTLDWIYVAVAAVPRLLNFVVTTYHFTKPGLRFFLRRCGAIPKDQFSPDVHSVKTMIKTAKLGGSIMVFPEGRTTPSGRSETFERSTIKLIRHLKLPVWAIKMNGSYLTNPKWSTITRKGKVEIKTELLFTPEQIASMSEDELYERMCSALWSDEYEWQKEKRVRYRSKHFARGLENVLWQCPGCGAEFTSYTGDNEMICRECGNRVVINEYYDLIPDSGSKSFDSIADWYDWEVGNIKKAISGDEEISMTDNAKLQQILSTDSWLEPVGEGKISMNKEGFRYSGKRLGEDLELFIPINMLPAAAVGPGESFELYYQGEFFSFHPERAERSQKWSIFIEQMHDHFCERPAN